MNRALINALVKAALDAEAITKRDGQTNSRSARVGNFVTCLRREMGIYMTNKYVQPSFHSYKYSRITSSDSWLFILEPANRGHFNEELKHAIEQAHLEVYGDKTKKGTLTCQLYELNREVSSLNAILFNIESINKQADSIITDFREFAKQL